MIKQVFLNIGKKEVIYIFLMGIASFFTFVRSMCYGYFMMPQSMGYYAIAMTISSYGTFLNLGLMSGLNRELPVCLGGKRLKRSSDLVGETTTAVILLQFLGIVLFFIALAPFRFDDITKKDAMLLGALLAFSNTFSQMVLLRLRSEQKIMVFSILQIVQAAAFLFLGIPLIKLLGYGGAILAAFTVNILSFALMSRFFLNPVNYRYFKLSDLSYLMRIGMPMMVAGVFLNLQMGMDRLFLIGGATASQIGIYQIGILPLVLGIIISGVVSQYISPRLLYRFGEGQPIKYVFNRALQASMCVIFVMIAIFPLVWFSVSYIIIKWLPQYNESLPLIKVFYIGAVFTASNLTGVVMNAANRQYVSLFQSFILVCLCLFAYLAVRRFSLPLIWFAYINVIMQALNFFVETAVSYFIAHKTNVAGAPAADAGIMENTLLSE